jgi:hypothetical protein
VTAKLSITVLINVRHHDACVKRRDHENKFGLAATPDPTATPRRNRGIK